MENNAMKLKREFKLYKFRERGEETLMLLPGIVLLVAFIIIPFCMSIPLSFTNQKLIQGPVSTKFIAFRNYFQILNDKNFWQALINVFYFTIIVIPIQCGFALFVALAVNKLKIMKNLLRGLFFLTFITPMVIVVVCWKTLYQYPSGTLNSLLVFLSNGMFKPIDWLGNPSTAMLSIVILSAWQAYGFQMIIYLAGLQNISDELYETADLFGASWWQKLRYITWPCLRNTNILVLTITTIQALKLFTQVKILTHGGPLGATNTLVHYIYDAGFQEQKIGYSSAASLLMFIIIASIIIIQRLLLKFNKD